MALTEFNLSDVVGRELINQRIRQFNAMFPVSIENGGTGATSTSQARKNLGIYRPEEISFTGDETLTLETSIKNYGYVKIAYGIYNDNRGLDYASSAVNIFSADILSSTSVHSLSIEVDRDWSNKDCLVFASALMRVSGSGYTISIERNTGFIVERNSGNIYLSPQALGNYETINPKIKILQIIGYK